MFLKVVSWQSYFKEASRAHSEPFTTPLVRPTNDQMQPAARSEVANSKDTATITGINALFAQASDQSCLNRFFHLETWDVQAINTRRLDLLQKDSDTRYSDHGVIPIDDTLIDHDGKLIEDVGWFWDHAEERHKIAHDYMIANYVCSSGKHYPLDFRCFQKQDQCEARKEPFKSHTELFQDLVDWVNDKKIPGTFAMDKLLHQRPDSQPHSRETGRRRPTAWLRRLVEVQPQTAIPEPNSEGVGTGSGDRPGIPQADAGG